MTLTLKAYHCWYAFSIGTAFVVMMATMVVFSAGPTWTLSQPTLAVIPSPYGDEVMKKIVLCHWDASAKPEPAYKSSGDVAVDSALSGHGSHNEDIIPPFYYEEKKNIEFFAGLNWNSTNEDIWNGGACNGDGVIKATLTLVKIVTNDNGGTAVPTSWTLNASGPTNINGVSGNASVASALVDPGNYTLSETNGPTGYTASEWSCVKNGGSAVLNSSISLVNNDIATCTITNDDIAPTLKLEKVVNNNYGGTATTGDFTLTATGDGGFSYLGNASVAKTVKAGVSYTLSESSLDGYANGSWSCSNGQNSGSVTLNLAENVTCTVTNSDIEPKLTVVKVVENGTEEGDPVLTVTDFEPYMVGEVVVESGVKNGFNAGEYTVTETNQDNYVAVFSGACSLQGAVVLNIGDDKTCTITNTYNRPLPDTGTIRIIKTVINDNGGILEPGDFEFNVEAVNATDNFITGGDLTVDKNIGTAEITAEVGDFTVTESEVPGYAQGTVVCSGTVVKDEVVECKFTNDDIPGTVVVEKTVINDSGTGESIADDFSAVLDGDEYSETQGFQSVSDELKGSTTFGDLVAGDYVVSEEGPSGYSATYGGDCDEKGNVSVGIGETRTCTISNNDNAPTNYDVSVTKTADDTTADVGQTVVYTIEVANSGPATATGVVLTDVLPTEVTYVSDNGGEDTDFTSGTLTWNVGDLTSGSSKTLLVTVTIDSETEGTNFNNTASVPVGEDDTNPDNNSSTENVSVSRYYSLSGYVFEDNNSQNGEFDQEQENGLSGWVVFLDEDESDSLNGEERSTETDENGYYEFTGLPAGCYVVREVLQDGWNQTAPSADDEREYLVALGGATCWQEETSQEVTLLDKFINLFSTKKALAAINTTTNTDINFGNVKQPTSGGGGGGSSSGGGGGGGAVLIPTPTPTPQVLGAEAPTPGLPMPVVEGVATELPRTGAGALALLVPALLALAGVTQSNKKVR